MSDLRENDRTAELIERDAWLDLFQAAPNDARDRLGLTHATVAGMTLLGCRAIPITELNRAMAVGIERAVVRHDLEEATAWLDTHATSWALQVAPPVLDPVVRAYMDEEWLIATGTGWAKFVWTDATSVPRASNERISVAAADATMADVFGRTVVAGFGLPDACEAWFAALPGRSSWRCFLATVDGEVAGGGTLYCRNDAAWFGITTTLPAFRGMGVQRRVLDERIRVATAMGATVLTSETGQPAGRDDAGFSSYRNQQRAGFVRAYVRPNYKKAAL